MKIGSVIKLLVAGMAVMMLSSVHFTMQTFAKERDRLQGVVTDMEQDLAAHKEALKISRQQCDLQVKRFRANEQKKEALLQYYRENDKKDWCQKATAQALEDVKRNNARHVRELKEEIARVVTERNNIADRMQPISLCCKSCTAKVKTLLKGGDREEARKAGASAVSASIRAIEDPRNVQGHWTEVKWERPQLNYHASMGVKKRRGRGGGGAQQAGDAEGGGEVEVVPEERLGGAYIAQKTKESEILSKLFDDEDSLAVGAEEVAARGHLEEEETADGEEEGAAGEEGEEGEEGKGGGGAEEGELMEGEVEGGGEEGEDATER